ncbi:MAG: Rieske (2Fe-2S) protein [Acidobacteriota bacterium]|nr:Rieske (2Fe-2S) protein [Blastocatellia bacterium]MDW8412438.1 Rieske (2Fe-2S) protein [Acidobacteriota bacterium]
MSEFVKEQEAIEQETVMRRTFIRLGIGAMATGYAAAIGYPIYAYLSTPAKRAAEAGSITEVRLEGAAKLPAGSAMVFKFGHKPALLIHHRDGRWVAMDAVCTHLGCTVQYETDNNRVFCACHGGVYDAVTGENISGPPPKPLSVYRVEVKDANVVVAKS